VVASLIPREPLLFDRIAKDKVWGGDRLSTLFGVNSEFGGPIGETWELSDITGSDSRVRGGTFAGKTLRELMTQYPHEILGRSSSTLDGRFPLLVKFIDAKEDLSVQIHPPDGPRSPSRVGKTEAWYILDADEGAEVICGWKLGLTREDIARAVEEGAIEPSLNRVPVSKGDVVFIPAGQVHAILGGVFLVEIQQTSDVTFRFWDWGRKTEFGQSRELHLDQAIGVVDEQLMPGKAVKASFREQFEGALVAPLGSCPYFDLTAVRIESKHTHKLSGFASVVAVVNGSGTLSSPTQEFEARKVKLGDVFLLPGSLSSIAFEPSSDQFELLEGVAR